MVVLGALVVLGAGVACSPSDFVTYDDVLGTGDGAGEGEKQSVKVDGSAEARLTLQTGASLTIPKGAVDRSIEIGIERPEDDTAVAFVKALPSIKSAASAPYVLTPHGTKFMGRVTLELPVIEKHQGRELVAAYLEDEDDRDWKILDVPAVVNGKASLGLGHFSVVILLDRDTAGLEDEQPDAAVEVDKDGGVAPAQDAGSGGSALDAGVPVDAGGATLEDAAFGSYDAATYDSGKYADAAPGADDAGLPSDAAVAADAGVPYDSGVPYDAGILDSGFNDAGVPDDAGFDTGVVDAAQPPPDGALK